MELARSFSSFLVIGVLFFGFAAEAKDDDTVSSFQAAAVSIPQALLASGHRSFGRLDLSDLPQKMDSVHVVAVGSVRRAQPVGPTMMERDSAEWDRSGAPFIRVNRSRWSATSPQVRAVVALHEHLGVAGFNDQNYVISSGMWLLANPRAQRILSAAELGGVSERIYQEASAQGGVTGVGGGGDEFGARLKMTGLERALRTVERAGETSSRSEAVSDLYSRFYINNEIRRNSGLRADPTVTRESVTGGFQICQGVLRSSPAQQAAQLALIHRGGVENVRRQLPNVKAFVRFCRQLTQGGLDRALIGVES